MKQSEFLEKCGGEVMENIRDSLFGKTSQELSHQTKEWILEQCLKKSQKPKFQCLNLVDGPEQEWSEVTSVKLPGGHWMLNISASPSIVKDSSLSQILEEEVPQKYYLSVKACQGILKRAKKKGQLIHPFLLQALENTINNSYLKSTQMTQDIEGH